MRDNRAEFAGYAERVKSAVSIRDVLSMNGVQVNRHGFAVCPLHGDTDASLKVYGGSRGWVCYGCHKGGDVINLAMELYGLSFQDAVRHLNDDFDVGIDFDRKPTPKESFMAAARLAKMKAERKAEAEQEAYVERTYWKAFDKWLELDRRVQDLADSLDRAEGFTDEFCAALRDRAEVYEEIKTIEERRLKYG